MPLFLESNSRTLAKLFRKINPEKVAQKCWPFLAQFNWPLTDGTK
jgi:hypothetical protein